MQEALTLAAGDRAGSPRQRLFFAVRLDEAAAAAAIAVPQAADRGPRGHPVVAERLHITLHWLREHVELPPELVKRAIAAGRSVEMDRFDVIFDRVESLGDAAQPGPLVLRSHDRLASLRRFQRGLAAAMTDAGIGEYVRSSFKPHVSLLYGGPFVASRPIAPIRWAVSELLLIRSVVGAGRHIELGRWPLASRQAGCADW